MAYNIRKNWTNTIEIISEKSILLLPFMLIGFFEILLLEVLYFSCRKPIIFVFGPIIKKFFGSVYLHYPTNFLIISKMFYIGQIILYVVVGAFLSAILVNMIRNYKANVPVKFNAVLKNAASRYLAFVTYAVLIVCLAYFSQKIATVAYNKIIHLFGNKIPDFTGKIFPIVLSSMLFIIHVLLNLFFILTIPLMVLRKRSLLRALVESITYGFKNFLTLLKLLLVPYLVYLPIILLKAFSLQIGSVTIPEAIPIILLLGAIISIFVETFVNVSAVQFVIDNTKE